jgi:integrase
MIPRKLKTCTHYYYNPPRGKRIPLGNDLPAALKKYWEIETGAGSGSIADDLEEYRIKQLPKKSLKTQSTQNKQIDVLKPAFGACSYDEIKPCNIRQYLDKRSAKIAGNREIALFSHFWNWARQVGKTDLPNPCLGVDRNAENPRDVYIDDESFNMLWKVACPELQDYMDLALLTGQRNADIRKMKRTDIVKGELIIKQNKTKKPLRIRIEGELKTVIERILSRERKATGMFLIQTNEGQPLSQTMLSDRFLKARDLAGVDWQLRDIRAKMVSDEEDINIAQDRAGHADQSTTRKIYYRRGKLVSPLR